MTGYIVAIDQDDVIWLAWAAGLAAGMGNDGAAESIGSMLGRLQPFDREEEEHDPEAQQEEINPALVLVDEPEEERAPDPNFLPPPPAPPANPDSAFGAGPPPGLPS